MTINLAAHGDQRVAIFIDTQNLYHSAKSNFRANVNYEELIRVAVNGRKLVRAFAYVIRSEENTEGKFFEALEEIGIETRVKDLQVFHTGAKKADWDVGIAVDMIRLTEKVDVVVLASGDGDFLEVVRYCQSRGVRVEIMAFEKTTNAKISEEVDHFTDLGDKDSDFLIGNRKRRGAQSKPTKYPPQQPVVYPNKPVSNYLLATPNNSKQGGQNVYAGSNLSSINRMSGNANQNVNPTIFGRKGRKNHSANSANRKVRPVVGLPGSSASSTLGRKTLVNDQTKKPTIDNAFGNNEPPRKSIF
jgi:uncharacterized LabA/DUF88 family protein